MTPGTEPLWPQGNNLNKLGRGPLGDATNQISRLAGGGGAFFAQGHNLKKNLLDVH